MIDKFPNDVHWNILGLNTKLVARNQDCHQALEPTVYYLHFNTQ